MTRTHIWELEKGRASNPSLSVIEGLARYFDVSISSLIEDDIQSNGALGNVIRLAKSMNEQDLDLVQALMKLIVERSRSDGVSALSLIRSSYESKLLKKDDEAG